MMTKLIGIDNGLKGAIAVLSETSNEIDIFDMPVKKEIAGRKRGKDGSMHDLIRSRYDIPTIAQIIKENADKGAFVALEKAMPFPGQGVVSMFSTGLCFGIMQGILVALCVPFVIVAPQTWKNKFDLIGTEKEAAIPAAMKYFPDAEFFTPQGRALDGRADAALLAVYVRMNQE
jgi:crossover junction endodeoxyribonuclease RuvC